MLLIAAILPKRSLCRQLAKGLGETHKMIYGQGPKDPQINGPNHNIMDPIIQIQRQVLHAYRQVEGNKIPFFILMFCCSRKRFLFCFDNKKRDSIIIHESQKTSYIPNTVVGIWIDLSQWCMFYH